MQKKQIIKGLCITVLVATLHSINNNIADKQQDKLIQDYTTCIQEQSNTQGYILRHHCSDNYIILDQLSELEYIQKGQDLYIKQ